MAKREISSTLRNLKFMQRAAQREEKAKKEEEVVKPDENFAFPGTVNRKCFPSTSIEIHCTSGAGEILKHIEILVIMEGDPHPGAVIGRMSFQSFNPSIDKLNEEATNVPRSDASATSSCNNGGRMSFRQNQNGSSHDGAEASKAQQSSETNGDLKRKQSEGVPEPQYPKKSPKNVQGGQESSPSNNKDTAFKQPKRDKVDWSVLRPPKPQNKKG